MKWILAFYKWLRPADGDIHYNVMTDLSIVALALPHNWRGVLVAYVCLLFIAIGKELYDASKKGDYFDIHDLAADACGIIRGSLLYLAVYLIRLIL